MDKKIHNQIVKSFEKILKKEVELENASGEEREKIKNYTSVTAMERQRNYYRRIS